MIRGAVPRSPTDARLAPLSCLIVLAALVILGTVGFGTHRYGFVADRTLVLLTGVGYGCLGAWVWLHAVPVIGRRMTWVGLAGALNWAVQGWSATAAAAWASRWTWLLPTMLVPLVISRFPDGRRPGRVERTVEQVLAWSVTIAMLSLALQALNTSPATATNDRGPNVSNAPAHFAAVACVVWAIAAAAQLVAVTLRARSGQRTERGQLLCLVAALVVTFAGVGGLIVRDTTVFQVAVALALPMGIAVAVLRYAWLDLDLLVNRLSVWLALTGVVIGAIAGAGWLMTALVPDRWIRLGDVTVVVGLVLALDPARRLLQRGVNRLLYGHRDSPEQALRVLGQELGSATARQSAQELCQSVAVTLALPWVGLRQDGELVAAWGRTTSAPLEVPLGSGPRSGELLLCPRRAGERFGRADLRVVRAVASQVDVAVRTLVLAEDLRAARERVVRSREEERKRLRDELHDGVGPALAGARMQIRTLSRGSAGSLDQVDSDLSACAEEISRLVEGLRSPALEAGLAPALRTEAARWSGGPVAVEVAVSSLDDVRCLPAAVEIAAYRIAAEALSNAVRHASAKNVCVSLELKRGTRDDTLALRIEDDGNGVPGRREGGVGMTSMRDRAAELGGELQVVGVPGHGTTVVALLPIIGSPQ